MKPPNATADLLGLTLEHRGCRLAFDVRGDGPPVLLIQGVGVHGDGWSPQVDELAGQQTPVGTSRASGEGIGSISRGMNVRKAVIRAKRASIPEI